MLVIVKDGYQHKTSNFANANHFYYPSDLSYTIRKLEGFLSYLNHKHGLETTSRCSCSHVLRDLTTA